MSDYIIILGWGIAVVAAVVAMAGKTAEKSGGGGQRNVQLSDCVEVR